MNVTLVANSGRVGDWLAQNHNSQFFDVRDGCLTFAEANALDVATILFRLGFRPSEFKISKNGR